MNVKQSPPSDPEGRLLSLNQYIVLLACSEKRQRAHDLLYTLYRKSGQQFCLQANTAWHALRVLSGRGLIKEFPVQSLGGRAAIEYMITGDGKKLIARYQSGLAGLGQTE